jgi:hypothetical protein
MSLKDAIGNPICRGWALQVDANRGSTTVTQVFVLGLNRTGKQALVLGHPWYFQLDVPLDQTEDAVRAFDEGDESVPTYCKTPTRIVMTGDRL